jgi:protein O-mannosyl-transferase
VSGSYKKMEKTKIRPVSGSRKAQKPGKNSGWLNYTPLAIIVVVSFIIYLPGVLNNSFVWDDDGYILNNQIVQNFNLKGILSNFVMGNYHPVTMLFLSAEYQLFGLNATGYHTVNLLLHLLNVVLVFVLVSQLSGKYQVALVASLLFGIHPLHVESVAWASAQKDLLFTLFFLSSFILYLKYTSSDKRKHYLIALLLFLFSILSKAMAAPLPVLLLLADYFKGRKLSFSLLTEKIPFFLIAIIFGIVAVMAQQSTGSVLETTFSIPQHIAFACYGFVNYLIKFVIPLNLSAYYPYPILTGNSIPAFYYAFILIVGIVLFAVFYSVRFSKKILFCFGFFLLTIFLVLQLFPVGSAIMADRYSYLPSLGIFYLAGEGFVSLWDRNKKFIAIASVAIFTGFFFIKSYARSETWENNLNLWSDVINKYQNAPVAYLNRGTVFGKEKKLDQALEDFNKAIILNPTYAKAYFNRGTVYLEKGSIELAINDFSKTIDLNPEYSQAYFKRGNAYMDLRNPENAIRDFTRTIELSPDNSKAYNNRGLIFGDQGKFDRAKEDFDKAILLNPEDAEAYYNRAILYLNQQKFEPALKDFSKTIELNPGDAESFMNRGNIYSQLKQYDKAISDYSKVISLRPSDGFAYYNRGLAAYLSGRKDLAVPDLSKAVQLGNKQASVLLSVLSN